MQSLNTIFLVIISIIVVFSSLGLIFNSLGIDFAVYGNYMLWFIALTIFYLILPSEENNIFK